MGKVYATLITDTTVVQDMKRMITTAENAVTALQTLQESLIPAVQKLENRVTALENRMKADQAFKSEGKA